MLQRKREEGISPRGGSCFSPYLEGLIKQRPGRIHHNSVADASFDNI